MRSRAVLAVVAVVAAVALTGGLIWFQPWKLWVDQRVDETLPPGAATTLEESTLPTGTGPASGTAGTRAPDRPAMSTLLARGRFISHEHATHGVVSVVQEPGGRRLLAIADLSTSNGPDLHVWLTDAPVRRDKSNWHVFDDGEHVSLGTLKGNIGNQVYRIPSDSDLTRLTSVTIWCDRFDVSFGAAKLVPASGG